MTRDIGQHEITAVGEASLLKALRHIGGCESCDGSASHPFDAVLSEVLGENPATRHFMCCCALCPTCAGSIIETTLVTFVAQPTAKPYAESDVIFIDEPTLSTAQDFIAGCENCTDTAEVVFDQLLDAVTGCDPTTEYVVRRNPRCPRCLHEITANTLVQPSGI